MDVKDFIFQVFNEDYVASIQDNQIQKVESYGHGFILLESGRIYNQLDVQSNFWTSIAWKRQCYLNIIID